jgi:hypothetical protein
MGQPDKSIDRSKAKKETTRYLPCSIAQGRKSDTSARQIFLLGARLFSTEIDF